MTTATGSLPGATDGFVEVTAIGPSVLVQDLGRSGWAHLGVPSSGALDPEALMLANRLVGNGAGAVGLELLLGGLSLVPSRSTRVAVTGSGAVVEVDGRPQPWGEPVSVPAGATVAVARTHGGIRCWLAVDGGLAVAPSLGSASTDTLTGLGPSPVAAGDRLPLGPRRPSAAAGTAVPRATDGGLVSLRIRLGPREDWLTAESIRALTTRTYVVAEESDRVGIRLQADDGTRLERSRSGELPSEGIVTGAVQVPRGGQPLVFLADHPVTGGYPVVAVVDRVDLWKCAQLRPGDRARFQSSSSSARSSGS